MSNLNYKEMSRSELKKYVLTHRDDEEAWKEFISRPRPNAIHFPANMPLEEQEARFRELLQEKSS